MCYGHTVEYDSNLGKNETDSGYIRDDPWRHCAKWNESVTKNKYCMVLLKVPRVAELIRAEGRTVVLKDKDEQEMGS